jgi:hypothetical protein
MKELTKSKKTQFQTSLLDVLKIIKNSSMYKESSTPLNLSLLNTQQRTTTATTQNATALPTPIDETPISLTQIQQGPLLVEQKTLEANNTDVFFPDLFQTPSTVPSNIASFNNSITNSIPKSINLNQINPFKTFLSNEQQRVLQCVGLGIPTLPEIPLPNIDSLMGQLNIFDQGLKAISFLPKAGGFTNINFASIIAKQLLSLAQSYLSPITSILSKVSSCLRND